jgi:hypothetical protein
MYYYTAVEINILVSVDRIQHLVVVKSAKQQGVGVTIIQHSLFIVIDDDALLTTYAQPLHL